MLSSWIEAGILANRREVWGEVKYRDLLGNERCLSSREAKLTFKWQGPKNFSESKTLHSCRVRSRLPEDFPAGTYTVTISWPGGNVPAMDHVLYLPCKGASKTITINVRSGSSELTETLQHLENRYTRLDNALSALPELGSGRAGGCEFVSTHLVAWWYNWAPATSEEAGRYIEARRAAKAALKQARLHLTRARNDINMSDYTSAERNLDNAKRWLDDAEEAINTAKSIFSGWRFRRSSSESEAIAECTGRPPTPTPTPPPPAPPTPAPTPPTIPPIPTPPKCSASISSTTVNIGEPVRITVSCVCPTLLNVPIFIKSPGAMPPFAAGQMRCPGTKSYKFVYLSDGSYKITIEAAGKTIKTFNVTVKKITPPGPPPEKPPEKPKPPPRPRKCKSGEVKCIGYHLYKCIDGQWRVKRLYAPECGYPREKPKPPSCPPSKDRPPHLSSPPKGPCTEGEIICVNRRALECTRRGWLPKSSKDWLCACPPPTGPYKYRCREGWLMCRNGDLYQCRNNEWVLVSSNAPGCQAWVLRTLHAEEGKPYPPPTPPCGPGKYGLEWCISTTLVKCLEIGWQNIQFGSPRCPKHGESYPPMKPGAPAPAPPPTAPAPAPPAPAPPTLPAPPAEIPWQAIGLALAGVAAGGLAYYAYKSGLAGEVKKYISGLLK